LEELQLALELAYSNKKEELKLALELADFNKKQLLPELLAFIMSLILA
jgi:hypothetical protein